jgi:superfamily I DNA/RNA helicase/RecB family exonuclease
VQFTPDSQQKKAIDHVHGPMLVVAGAGTGKTTVLVERVVRLIESGAAPADEIVAVTFTHNAALELRERVASRIGALWAGALQVCTFHAYCNNLLTRAGKNFTPLTREDLYVLLRRELRNLGLKYYIRAAKPGQFLNSLLTFFDRCDDELVTATRYREYVEEVKAGKHPLPRVLKSDAMESLKREEVIDRCEEIAIVFSRVNEMLAERSLGTFGQQISRAVRLLAEDAQMRGNEQSHARFILIDEFQDSNIAQIKLCKLLAGDTQNIFAVGDPDQAIYRFRGATSGAFDHFCKEFSNVQQVALTQNRRSLGPILRCAFRVIDQNSASLNGLRRQPLVSAREAAGEKGQAVELTYIPSQLTADVEAIEVADAIEKLHRQCPGHATRTGRERCSWKHIAILFRQHTHREQLARELTKRRIPVVVRGVDVLDTPEVRDAMAVVRAITNRGDNAALFRVASLPMFAIDPAELRAALSAAGRHARLETVLAKVKGGPRILEMQEQARAAAEQVAHQAAAVLEIGIKHFAITKSEAVRALQSFTAGWLQKNLTVSGSIEEFLEYLQFYTEANGRVCLPEPEDSYDAVQFMSVHIAKGLEFPHVFVLRATSGSFPSHYQEDLFEFPAALRDSLATAEGDPKELHKEEERRLFYVGMTRARDTLSLYGKRSSSKKQPMPPCYIEASPPGFMREIVADKSVLQDCSARLVEPRLDIQASRAETQAYSPAAEWMLLPPARSMDSISLSATRIETYNLCPLRFKIETDWNLPGEPAPAMQFGNAVHTALKAYNDSIQAGRPLSQPDLLQVFVTQMEISAFEDPHQRKLYLEQGLKQLAEFYYLRNLEPRAEVLSTEKVFSIIIGGVKVVGRIDLAQRSRQGGITILDYKTGVAKDEEEADKSLQLSIYALAAQQEWNELPESVAFYNLENNAEVRTARSLEDLEGARARIMEVAQSIQAGKFRPKTGFHCQWCGYRELCPAQEEPLYSIASALPAKATN